MAAIEMNSQIQQERQQKQHIVEVDVDEEDPDQEDKDIIIQKLIEISASFDTTGAFTVLSGNNKDHPATVVQKPNAIVRPVRRDDLSTETDRSVAATVTTEVVTKKDIIQFTKELDSKLRRLQYREKPKRNENVTANSLQMQKRPLFITTVPKGVFLQPVKEIPIVRSSHKGLYAFASRPKVIVSVQQRDSAGEFLNRKTRSLRDSHQYHQTCSQQQQQSLQSNQGHYQNVMHEKRVARGSNFSQPQYLGWNPNFGYAGLLSGKGGECCLQPIEDEEVQKRRRFRRQLIRKQNALKAQSTPPPVFGRKHTDVQTEKYLEELFDRPPEEDATCQTDLFLQRPPTPPHAGFLDGEKIGIDVATEIPEGDLFDYYTEVQPIVDALVGRCLEQARVEVSHEEELAALKWQREYLASEREAELAALRRAQALDARLHAETERRMEQDRLSAELDECENKKTTAAKLLRGHIADLMPTVLASIEPVVEAENRAALEMALGPWLASEVAAEVGQMIDSRELLEEIVREILQDRAQKYMEGCPPKTESELDFGEEGEFDDDTQTDATATDAESTDHHM